MIKVIFPLSHFIFLSIVTIHYPLTPPLSAFTINIVSYSELMKFLTLDIILTSSPIPDLLMSPTNNTYHLLVILEPDTKLNAPLLPPIVKVIVMIVLLSLLDDDDPDVSSSLIHHHLMQYMYVVYHRLATSTFLSTYQCSHRNCRSCVQDKISIITIYVLLQPCSINDQLEQLIPLLK